MSKDLIPADKIKDLIGSKIHLAWANPGAVWVLKKIHQTSQGTKLELVTPKTGKTFMANAQDACYLISPQKGRIREEFLNASSDQNCCK